MHIFLVALAMWVVYHQKHQKQEPLRMLLSPNLGALKIKIRIGVWGPLYYSYKKEPPNSTGNY